MAELGEGIGRGLGAEDTVARSKYGEEKGT